MQFIKFPRIPSEPVITERYTVNKDARFIVKKAYEKEGLQGQGKLEGQEGQEGQKD